MQSSFRFFVCFAVGFFLALAGCEQWEPVDSTTEFVLEQKKQMSMSPVSAADYGGTLPLTSISCPDAGEKVKAEDIRAPVAALLAADEYTMERIPQYVETTGASGAGAWTLNNPNTWNVANALQTIPALTNNVDIYSRTVAHEENDWFVVTAQFEAVTTGTVGTDDAVARLTEDGGEFGQRVRISPYPVPISITATVQAGVAGNKTFTIRIDSKAAPVYVTGPIRLVIQNLGKTKATP